MSLLAILALAAGTYAFRIIGPMFRHRVRIPARVEQLLSDASVVLLVALVANSTLISSGGFAGWSRVIGVTVGGVLALVNLPAVRQAVARRFARPARHSPERTDTEHETSSPPGRRRRPVHIPFPVIIIAAAAVAAVLRLAGVS